MNKLEEIFATIFFDNAEYWDVVDFNKAGVKSAIKCRKIAIEYHKYLLKWIEVVLNGDELNRGKGIINDEFYKKMFDNFIEDYGNN